MRSNLLLPTTWLVCTALTVSAANYDANLAAPKAPKAEALRAALSDYTQIYKQLGPDGVLRDRTAYARRLHSEWLLIEAIDANKAGDLREFGWTRAEDGTYSVKVRDFPQWRQFDTWLELLTDPHFLSSSVELQLKQRGFRDQDIATLRTYIETHDLKKEVARVNTPLTSQFAERVRTDAKARRTTAADKVRAYIYQTRLATDEARRAWSVGLLDALDKQRQRILVVHFLDTPGGRGISPTTDAGEGMRQYVELLKSGELERRVERQLAGVSSNESH